MVCGHLAICSHFGVISFSHFCFDLGPWPMYPSFALPQNVDYRKGSTRGPSQIQLHHLKLGNPVLFAPPHRLVTRITWS